MIHEPAAYPLTVNGHRNATYVAVGESPADALQRMWGRLCVGEPVAVLPCGCTQWRTKYGQHQQRGPSCTLNGYQHEDILRWIGVW